MNKRNKILFINLSAFSLTGGIEKFNKCFLKALNEWSVEDGSDILSYSLYDTQADDQYFPIRKYKGFGLNRISFVFSSIKAAKKVNCIIIGHINLAIIGFLIKIIYPSKKIILITHGIEVWKPLSGFKKKILEKANFILAVSQYTAGKLLKIQQIGKDKIVVFPNTIDPFFQVPVSFAKAGYLQQRYGLTKHDFVLFTLTRLSSAEKYKGYDAVIKCLPELTKAIPNLKYIIAGKYDISEKERVDRLVNESGMNEVVKLTGFVNNDEVCDHYQLGDVFIMPSQGEGFGIVFIEAAVCGSKVIAGNQDGSVDALRNGELGCLVNPTNTTEITQTILEQYRQKEIWNNEQKLKLQQKTISYFGFNVFKQRLKAVLKD